jgi:hypothetical protein
MSASAAAASDAVDELANSLQRTELTNDENAPATPPEQTFSIEELAQNLLVHGCSPELPLSDDYIILVNHLATMNGPGDNVSDALGGDDDDSETSIRISDIAMQLQGGMKANWDALGTVPYFGTLPNVAYALTNGHGPSCEQCCARVKDTEAVKVAARAHATGLRSTAGMISNDLFALYYIAYALAGVNGSVKKAPLDFVVALKRRMNTIFIETHKVKQQVVDALSELDCVTSAREALAGNESRTAAQNDDIMGITVAGFAHNILVPYTQRVLAALERMVMQAYCLGVDTERAKGALTNEECYLCEYTQYPRSLLGNNVAVETRDAFNDYAKMSELRGESRATQPQDTTVNGNPLLLAPPVEVNLRTLQRLYEQADSKRLAMERGMPPLKCVVWTAARFVRLAHGNILSREQQAHAASNNGDQTSNIASAVSNSSGAASEAEHTTDVRLSATAAAATDVVQASSSVITGSE